MWCATRALCHSRTLLSIYDALACSCDISCNHLTTRKSPVGVSTTCRVRKPSLKRSPFPARILDGRSLAWAISSCRAEALTKASISPDIFSSTLLGNRRAANSCPVSTGGGKPEAAAAKARHHVSCIMICGPIRSMTLRDRFQAAFCHPGQVS